MQSNLRTLGSKEAYRSKEEGTKCDDTYFDGTLSVTLNRHVSMIGQIGQCDRCGLEETAMHIVVFCEGYGRTRHERHEN